MPASMPDGTALLDTAHGTRHTAHGALADRDPSALEPRTDPNTVLTPHIARSLG